MTGKKAKKLAAFRLPVRGRYIFKKGIKKLSFAMFVSYHR
ncbi:hypothetical protein CC1_15320 [Coprococcus catus GD/7]|uniref:Uncharacterized protein n=1 Tax=Coprococcus catus GD/7 TaxID=717962 RepID=D4J7I4_9FIRM|nr:hypothetical protein CC1_15320 [Coprococcus catus GD/7]